MNENASKEYLTGYSNGFDDGRKAGREELSNELNKILLGLKANHSVIDISVVIKMIEDHKNNSCLMEVNLYE